MDGIKIGEQGRFRTQGFVYRAVVTEVHRTRVTVSYQLKNSPTQRLKKARVRLTGALLPPGSMQFAPNWCLSQEQRIWMLTNHIFEGRVADIETSIERLALTLRHDFPATVRVPTILTALVRQMYPFDVDVPRCRDHSGDWEFACTRARSHYGIHVAHLSNGEPIAAWR